MDSTYSEYARESIERTLAQIKANVEYMKQGQKDDTEGSEIDTWLTSCGDIVCIDIYRRPDLIAVLRTVNNGRMSTTYEKKIFSDNGVHFLKIDGKKWYFHKEFELFETQEYFSS